MAHLVVTICDQHDNTPKDIKRQKSDLVRVLCELGFRVKNSDPNHVKMNGGQEALNLIIHVVEDE